MKTEDLIRQYMRTHPGDKSDTYPREAEIRAKAKKPVIRKRT